MASSEPAKKPLRTISPRMIPASIQYIAQPLFPRDPTRQYACRQANFRTVKRFGKGPGIAIAVVAIAIGVIVFDRLQHGGAFKRLVIHIAGTCRNIALGGTAADIRIDDRGIALLAYARPGGGTVVLMDLNVAEPRARAALATEPASF